MKKKTEQRMVVCEERSFLYTLTRKKVKNINLRIKPDGQICVSAHPQVPVSEIDHMIRKNQKFLKQTLEKMEQKQRQTEKRNQEPGYPVEIFQEIIDEVYRKFQKYQVPYPKVRIRHMTSRWGSCQPATARMTLNSRLLRAPRNDIEYVVVHEFAHFLHPNHSKQFWDVVEEFMPDWRERRQELNELPI